MKGVVEGELAYFFDANPQARQADVEELLELWRLWIAQRVPNAALAQMTIEQVTRYREGEGPAARGV